MYKLKSTRSFGTNGNGNISLLKLSQASFIAYPNSNNIYILTDHDKWCDRKNTSTKPPFVLWQKLKVEESSPVCTVAWCEELSNMEKENWFAAATSTSVYLFAATNNYVSSLPIWKQAQKIDVQKRGLINALSWSSVFGVRKLLVGGNKLNLFAINGISDVPLTIWKAKRYPVSGSVVIDAKLSMDGRLFATAEKSSRVVRVWFKKHGVHGAYSCAHLPHEYSVISISWRPYLTTSAKGDVQMIHGTSTRRALMTLTSGSIVYIWQESDKSEEFRMLLALTFGGQNQIGNFSISSRLLSSVWVTYRQKDEQFGWGDSINDHNNIPGNIHGHGSASMNVSENVKVRHNENAMANQKKIISKSHGHILGKKETSVRLGPYAEHFEDTDYIVGLTSENTVKVWVISGIDAQPRCSIGVKAWGSAVTSNIMNDTVLVTATCFITEAGKLLSKQSIPSLTNGIKDPDVGNAPVISRSMPEPIRLCLMLKSEKDVSCKAVWLEWDANRPLSMAGQAAYEKVGNTTEARLYDAGHSQDIISISTLRNGNCLENAAVTLDANGILKTWNVDSVSGVSLRPSSELQTCKVTGAKLWGGTIRTENGDECWTTVLVVANKNNELLAYVHQNATLVLPNDESNSYNDSTWDFLCKTNLDDNIFNVSSDGLVTSLVNISIIGIIDSLYIGLSSASSKTVAVGHLKVFDRVLNIISKKHVFPEQVVCASFSKCNAAFTYSKFYVGCSNNKIYSWTINSSDNETFEIDLDVNFGANRGNMELIDFASTSKSSKLALIVNNINKMLFQVEIYDEKNGQYEMESSFLIENYGELKGSLIIKKCLQVEWLHRYGHDSFIVINCGTRVDILSSNFDSGINRTFVGRSNERDKNMGQLRHQIVKIATTDNFDSICKGISVKNNGDILLNFGTYVELYDRLLYYTSNNNMKLQSMSIDDVFTDNSCIPSYHPNRLMQNVYCNNIQRIRVTLTNLLDSIDSDDHVNENEVSDQFDISFDFGFSADKDSTCREKLHKKKIRIPIPNIEEYLVETSKNENHAESKESAAHSFTSFTSRWVMDDDDDGGFTKTEEKKLNILVHKIKSTDVLSGKLSKIEISRLCAFIKAFISIYGDKRHLPTELGRKEAPIGEYVGLDDSAIKYLMALKVSINLSQENNDNAKNIKNEDYSCQSVETCNLIWASLSTSSNLLITKCITVSATWADVRSVGATFWIDNGQSICSLAEKLARQQYLKSDRDPYSCLLFYSALGKLKVIAGLFKMKREEKFYNFFMNDFTQTRWKSAALKNGYALMKQHKYELAAAFLLIGGKIFEAARICEKNLGDIQLALFIVRIVESSQTLTSDKYLKPWIEKQLLDYAQEHKDLFIQCMAYKLLEKDSEINKCIRENFLNFQLNHDVNQSNAVGERWLRMSNGLDPTLALVYRHMKDQEKKKTEKNEVISTSYSSASSLFDNDGYNSNNKKNSIFDSFDLNPSNIDGSSGDKGSGGMFDSLDFKARATNNLSSSNNLIDEKKQFDNITKLCSQMYANAGMPLLSLELLSETVQNLHDERVVDVGLFKFVEMCIEKVLGAYLRYYDEEINMITEMNNTADIDAAPIMRSLNEITEEFINVVKILGSRFGKEFIFRDILSSHVEMLSGKQKYVQALLLQSAINGASSFNKLPQLMEALSLNMVKVIDNGLKLEASIKKSNDSTILYVTRKFACHMLSLKRISSKYNLWQLKYTENEINDKMLFDFALATLATKIAWSTRHILLLSEILLDDLNGGNTFQNISSYSKLLKLLEEPDGFSYHREIPYENECIIHILCTKMLLKLWIDYVLTIDKNGVIDPWIDTTVKHYDASLLSSINSSHTLEEDDNAAKLVRICFTFATYYNSLMEDSHKMQHLINKLSIMQKDAILSENAALKTIWMYMKPEEEILDGPKLIKGVSSPRILSDVETSADEEDNLDNDIGKMSESPDDVNKPTSEYKTSTRIEASASAIFNSINNITGIDQRGKDSNDIPFIEIVHTTNISILSFCFDKSDSASPYATVATANGIIETNIESSLKFRKRDKSKKILLDRDDLSWVKSRDRFWQEENAMLERDMIDLAVKESSDTPTLMQLMQRGRFTVSRQDHFRPNTSEIEERTLESMYAMNAGRSFTVDDLQASCMESHTRFPFYMCGNELGELSLWSFGERHCLAMYSEPCDRSCGINSIHFNGLGDKFVACDTSGIVRLWKFGSNPNCLNPYEYIDTELQSVKDTRFLNSGSVIALGGSSNPNDKRVNGSFQLWDTLLPPSARKLCSYGQNLDYGPCNSLLYLPDEELFICGYGNGKLMAFDIRQRCMLGLESFSKKLCHKASVTDIAYNPHRDVFSTASSDGCIKLWDSHTLKLKQTYENVHNSVTKLSFHGNNLYSSGLDGRVLMHSL